MDTEEQQKDELNPNPPGPEGGEMAGARAATDVTDDNTNDNAEGNMEGNVVAGTLEKMGAVYQALEKGAGSGVSILNGIFGDRLAAGGFTLARQMSFIHQGRILDLTPAVLKEAHPEISDTACIFVHGLVSDEGAWSYSGYPEKTYGSLLQDELGFTPFYLRYNSGQHISTNGQELSELLDLLYSNYPIALKEIHIVAHSMGGLVARSACEYRPRNRLGFRRTPKWAKSLGKIMFLGTPHLGAPLEKFGNLVTNVLQTIPNPFTKLTGDLINLRSDGIKDLRFGYTAEKDWKDQDKDALLENNKTPVNLPGHVDYYIITGGLNKDPDHPVTKILGDILVRQKSARGESKNEELHLGIPEEHKAEFPGLGHMALSRHPKVYRQLKKWFAPS